MDQFAKVLVVNKPAKMTSHDVVNQLRKIFKTRQVGHFGTLDPDATGVLVVGIGSLTKLAPFCESAQKTYQAEVILGVATTTDDFSGEVIEYGEVLSINQTLIDQTLETMIGPSSQIPPMYAAIKVNGKKLYEYARLNQEVNLTPRDIEIYQLKRISELVVSDQLIPNHLTISFKIMIKVSKGTYIRAFCRDLGLKLNTFGTMGNLVRTASGSFTLEDSSTLDEISQGNYLIPSWDQILPDFKIIDIKSLNDQVYQYVKSHLDNGMKISTTITSQIFQKIGFIENNQLKAIYQYHQEDDKKGYKAIRIWK